MSANPKMRSSSSTSSVLDAEPNLKVGLQAVLRSLDVGLEDELTRYRRKRRSQAGSGVALAAHSAEAVQAARAAIAQITSTSPGLGSKPGVVSPAATPSPDLSLKNLSRPQQAVAAGVVPLDSSLVSLGLVSLGLDPSAETSQAGRSVAMPLGSTQDEAGDRYFASSAALLETLADESEDASIEPASASRLSRLMTPGGIGASMLLLLGSATAGYLVLHPDSLNHLQFQARPQQPSVGKAASAQKQVNPDLPPGAPDLSQREFVDLTLSNLGSLSLSDLSPTASQPAILNGMTLPGVPGVPGALGQGVMAPGGMNPGLAGSGLTGSGLTGPGLTSAEIIGNALTANGATGTSPTPVVKSGLLKNLANAVAGPAPQ